MKSKSNSFGSRFLQAALALLISTIIIVGVNSFPTAELDSQEIPVRVELVNRKRVRRHISPLSTTPDFEYHLKISSDSDHPLAYDLKLQPLPHSVFSPAFKYTEFGEDEAGNPVTRSFVPSREEFDLIESRLYTDKDTKSFVRLEQDDEGDIELYGVIDRARIRTRRDTARGKNSFSIKKPTIEDPIDVTPPDLGPDDMNDVFEVPFNASGGALPSRRSGAPVDLNAWVNIEPELAIVLDYQMTQDIGGDWNRKLEYAAITVNGVNGYYELANDSIRIKCELVHVMEMKSEAQMQWLTDLEANRTERGDGKWTMKYDARKVLPAYQKWVYQHAEEIGNYDIAPILMGASFGSTLGIAAESAACFFKFFLSSSLAAVVNLDYGANFEGIAVMAHEIGHNLGAPHDGEASKRSLLGESFNTESCLFAHGFLMGYNRHNYTNGFHFSKCSLDAIKTYVTTDNAACLRPDNKTGRPIIHTSVREGGTAEFNPFSRRAGCSRISQLGFRGVPSYQTADVSCRFVKCEAMKRGGVEKYVRTHLILARDTQCGDNKRKGKCRNGFCVGQGPALDMDSVCKKATRYADSQFYAGNTTLDQICSSKAWSCSAAKDRVRTFKDVIVVPGTPCGDTKICFNQECVEKDKITDPNKECILQTGKQEAKQVQFKHPDPKCAGLMKCTYETEFELIGPASTDPACNPAAAGPDSLTSRGGNDHEPPLNTGDTAHESTENDGTLQQAMRTLQDVCEKKEPGSTVKIPDSGDRNELCSNLICAKAGQGGLDEEVGVAPEGIICGPLRRCKSGKCEKCGQ